MARNNVIILGAPRSGTNLLRDLLTSNKNLITWDCDEINPIWRYGNYRAKSDEDFDMQLSNNSFKFIREKFEKLRSSSDKIIVEKTCANALRPKFVKECFPDSRFIIIQRDGYDCTISAKKKGTKKFDLKYQFSKWRYAPWLSLPSIIKAKLNGIWGPHYRGMEKDLKVLDPLEIAAVQWKKCNEHLLEFEKTITPSSCIRIRYEDLVHEPDMVLSQLFRFIFDSDETQQFKNHSNVYQTSIGKARNELSKQDIKMVGKYISETNFKLGYSE